MKKIRVVGDIHGQPNNYKKIIEGVDASIQLGDFGFDYRFLENVDYKKHVFFPGNHDNYDKCFAYSHCLGRAGIDKLNGIEFFFVSGGFSIDKNWRIRHQQLTGQKSYWSSEEMNDAEMTFCLDMYKDFKPEFVITHECPRSVSKIIGNPDILRNFGFDPDTFTTRTSELLEEMFKTYEPKLWIFGHYHKREELTMGRTKFICLPEFGYCDVDEDLEVTRLWTN